MIQSIAEYIKNIALFLIFMTLVAAVTPKSKYKEYVSLVLGLIFIFIALSPVKALLEAGNGRDFALELQKGIMIKERDYYSEEQRAEALETYRTQLCGQTENLVAALGYSAKVNIELYDDERFGEINRIYLNLTKKEAEPTRIPIIRIEEVKISKNTPESEEQSSEASPEEEKIKKAVSDFYNVPTDNIYIIIQNT